MEHHSQAIQLWMGEDGGARLQLPYIWAGTFIFAKPGDEVEHVNYAFKMSDSNMRLHVRSSLREELVKRSEVSTLTEL